MNGQFAVILLIIRWLCRFLVIDGPGVEYLESAEVLLLKTCGAQDIPGSGLMSSRTGGWRQRD
jgi:hypothetical protein